MATTFRQGSIRRAVVTTAFALILVVGDLWVARQVVATGNTMRIDPAVQAVPQGGTFTAHILQTVEVPTSGAAATITFDPTLLQIQSVTRAAAYVDAPVFTGASAIAITAANTTGSLVGVAAAFLPPDAVPAGESGFLDITFHAIGCGTAQLGLPAGGTGASLLDGSPATYGNALQVSTVGGYVFTCVAPCATAAPSGSAPASPSTSLTPSVTPTTRL